MSPRSEKIEKVLVLDANERAALAVTRSLGSKGVYVVSADSMGKSLSGSSRYSREFFTYPSPYKDEAEFVKALKIEISRRGVTMFLPVSEVSTRILLSRRDEFKDIAMPFASLEAFEQLNNKVELIELARKLDVPVPATYPVTDPEDLQAVIKVLTYPVVIKPGSSREFIENEWKRALVRYASSQEELEKVINETPYFRDKPFLIQELINGEGRGIFTVYKKGRPLIFFSHRRIRENPPSGGQSVLSESVPVSAELEDYARRILDHVKWHGIAMVEFKVTADGRPYLMEINPRFWGSLQLSIDAGIDFPWMLYMMAKGKPVEMSPNYSLGTKNRWLLGDLDHLYYKFAKKVYRVRSIREGLTLVMNFLNFFDEKTHCEVLRCDDLRPFICELRQTISDIKKRILHGPSCSP